MGINRYKMTVECDCGCDWGSPCGKKDIWIFCYNRSCDVGTLYLNGTHVLSGTDKQLAAIHKVMNSSEFLEECTPDELKLH
jgi:hypothetical protein